MKIFTHISTTIKSTVMIATATLLAVVFLLVAPGVRAATPAFVQVQAKKISSGNVNSQTFSTTAGNMLVVYVLWENNQGVTVADGGNTYQPVAPVTLFNGNKWSSQVFYANNLAGGNTTLSVTFNKPISSWAMVYAHEYSGVDKSSNPVDAFNTVVGNSGAMSNSVTTTKANDLLFATGAANGCVTSSGTFTTRSTLSCDRTMDKIAGAAGTYSISPSHYGNPWVTHLIAFKADSGDTQAPSVPAGLSAAAASETQINLSWNASSDNVGVTGYKIYRNGMQVGTATAISYSDGGLAPNTAYSYTVSAYDAAGNNSAQSASASGTTLPDTTAPSVPAVLTAAAVSDTQINLSWDASTDNIGATGYKIFQGGAEIATTSGTSYSNTGLAASTTYSYTVSAFDAAGNNSAQSAAASATTQAEPDTTAPSVPTNLVATAASSTVVDLAWNASTDNVGVTGYKVYRDGVEIAASVTDTIYQDTDRTAGATYNYTVSAFDAAGNNSVQSTAASVTMPAPPDTTPPVLSTGQPTGTLASGTTTATLSLITDETATCRYDNVAGTSYDAMSNTFTTTGGTSHSSQLSGLADDQSYSYFVRCQDAANNANNADYTISFSVAAPSTSFSYERVVVDSASMNNPWMKGVGDFNGDGVADLMVSGENGPVVWYETPTWTERQISATASSQSGSAVGDIDGDGDIDVIVGVTWYENIDNATSWVAHTLPGSDSGMTHDIVIADLNGDGKKDIAMRGEGSAVVQIFLQADAATWTSFTVDPGLGLNGLDIADVNNDGRPDVVVGGKWMENPGGAIATTPWPTRVVTNTWNGYAAVKVADLNGDGRQDMVMSVSEEVGKLSWFEQLVDGTWLEHVVDTDLNSVHGVTVEDIDKDGLLDIVASEYRTPGDLTIYRNTGGALGWEPNVLGSDGLHNLQAADFNGDCKLDFFGVHAFGVNPVVVYRSTGANACPPSSSIFPLRASTNGRYLEDQNGTPFLIMGDSPQGIVASLLPGDVEYYLDNRKSHDFNTLWINLLSRTQTGGEYSGAAATGALPFTGYLGGNTGNPGYYDLTTPSQAYFDHAKFIIREAAERGMLVVLDPIETMDHMDILRRNGNTRAHSYGQYLGSQFSEFNNIIWMHGNDFNDYMNDTDRTLVRMVGEGIRNTDTVDAMQTVLGFASPSEALDLVFDPNPDDTAWAPLINISTVYTYGGANGNTLNEYNRASSYNDGSYSRGAIPVYLAETFYDFEESAIDNRPNRKLLEFRCQQYSAMLGGATGHTYGSYRTVGLDAGWNTANSLDTPAVANFKRLTDLFESYSWYQLVPQNSMIVAGGGEASCGEPYGSGGGINTGVSAARTADGSLAMVYLPSARTVTLNTSLMNGTFTARWFDPTTGTYTNAACVVSGGNCQFTPPGTTHNETTQNYQRDGIKQETSTDWVLVLQAGEPDTEAPSVPTGLQAAAQSSSRIDLSWTASTDNVGVAGYKIYRDGVLVNGNVTGTTYQDTGLSAETTYSYTVSAFDASGNNSAQSTSTSATTLAPSPPDTTPPTVPTGVSAAAVSASQINLTWTASTDDGSGVKNYRVLTSTDNIDFALVGSPTTASFSHTNLNASTTYYYKVQAEDNAGNVSGDSAVVSAATQTPPPLSEFLKAAWGFNEGSGTTASDASTNGNTATITGTNPWGTGKYGTGLSFSGTTHLSVPNSASTNISGNELTLSLWVNPQQGSTTDSILLGKFWHPSTWTDPYYQFGFELWGGNQPVFQVGTSSSVQSATMGSTIPLNQWTHLAVTFSGSQVKFYVNGNLVSTKTLNATITARGNAMFIGTDQSVGQHFKGGMDDVRIYNKALTEAEIESDMGTSL